MLKIMNPFNYNMFFNIEIPDNPEGMRYFYDNFNAENSLHSVFYSSCKRIVLDEDKFNINNSYIVFFEDKNSISLSKIIIDIKRIKKHNLIIPDIEIYKGDDMAKYDKINNKYTGDINSIIEKTEKPNYSKSKEELIKFIDSVLKYTNDYVYLAFHTMQHPIMFKDKNVRKNLLTIFANNTINKLEECMKNIGFDTTLNCLKDPRFELQNSKKLNSSIKMPIDVMNFISNPKNNSYYGILKDLCDINPNEAIYLIKWIELLSKKQLNFINKDNDIKNIIKAVYQIKMDYKDIKLFQLIPYLVKQNLFKSMLKYNRSTSVISLIRDYHDYLRLRNNLKENNNIPIFPSILSMSHNILVRNQKIIKDAKTCEQFNKIVKNWSIYDFEDKNFLIKHPSDTNDLIEEGQNLHHCVATYIPIIATNITKVFLLRKKSDPKKSFVTVELTNDNVITQVKENLNQDVVDQKVFDFLDNWLENLRFNKVI